MDPQTVQAGPESRPLTECILNGVPAKSKRIPNNKWDTGRGPEGAPSLGPP